jgi:hypothetical protein
MTAPRSGTHTAPLAVPMGGQGVVWQGSSLDGQHIFRLSNGANGWQCFQATIGTAATFSFKPVTTGPLYLAALAAIGSQYAMLQTTIGSVRGNRIPANAAALVGNTTISNGVGSAATRNRTRAKVSGRRVGANTS